MKVKKIRESNIELLRIISMIGVIILHYNNEHIGGAFKYVISDSINSYILYFIESLFICAVNLFILISGYFMINNKKRNLIKPLELILQIIIFSVGNYLLQVALGNSTFSLETLFLSMIPNNYFVILYIVLYFISPFLNILINHLNNNLKQMLVSITLLFSIWPTLVDLSSEIIGREWIGLSSIGAYGSQWGYSIINFILMYIIGAYLRIKDDTLQLKEYQITKLIITLILNTSIIFLWACFNDYTGYFTERSAWEYCNPLVITNAVILFKIFKTLKIKPNKKINDLAKGTFTVFLVHSLFIGKIGISMIVVLNPFIMLIHMIISSICIYGVCWLIYKIYEKVTNPLYKLLLQNYSVLEKNIYDLD